VGGPLEQGEDHGRSEHSHGQPDGGKDVQRLPQDRATHRALSFLSFTSSGTLPPVPRVECACRDDEIPGGGRAMSQHPRPKFTYLGHATVRCELPGGEILLIDPWVQGNPACPEAHKRFDRLDAMLITHAHFDHMGDAIELAKQHKPKIVVANFEICTW